MNLDLTLRTEIQKAVTTLFNQSIEQLQLQPTNEGFEGSHTLVCFPITKISKKGPEETARLIGEELVKNSSVISKYNVVKGFLNLVIADAAWVALFQSIYADKNFGQLSSNGKEIMVEYSSPNTNKPLHLGHLRNNFLGWSVAEIFKANGYHVHKVQIINDRGIHICKSMAAWKLFGNGETPQSSGLKGDHLVGKYYVVFDKTYKAEIQAQIANGVAEADAEKQAPIMKLAVEMLQKWEAKDAETVELWKTMNGWVYNGFGSTYQRMGVDFEKLYYESDTYLLGKEEVLKGVEKGIFFKKEDGSVWVDLTSDGLDQKVLLRSDGTSVYMTQDIGTAILRFRDFPKIEGQVYTVGNEQEYHFKVLFLILKKLGYAWAEKCYHLSYGMVDLPTGKMKSREGTVVDADDLMQEMVDEAAKQSQELGKIDDMSAEERSALSEMVGLGALKFFLLKVDPKKRMLFDPNESIQLQGHTGPFIQYTHARIKAILRKAASLSITPSAEEVNSLEPAERDAIFLINTYHQKLQEAAREYSPAVLSNYAYDLAKSYNQFYQAIPIFHEADQQKLKFRIAFSEVVADVLKSSMNLLGIQVPERM
ncbi:MAG: arginine--tRNA ligase [Azospira oryzae]|nr:MAG: arginine--tRNA ligase [Azospira oryzae]